MPSLDSLYAARVARNIDTVVTILRAAVYGLLLLCWIAVVLLAPAMLIALIPGTAITVIATELSLIGMRWMKAVLDIGGALHHALEEQKKLIEQQMGYQREWSQWQVRTGKTMKDGIEQQSKLLQEQCQYLSDMATSS